MAGKLTRAEEKRALQDDGVEPLAVSVSGAKKMAGLSHTQLYRELNAGRIKAVKSGTKTLVLVESIRAYLAALPPAKFGQQKAA